MTKIKSEVEVVRQVVQQYIDGSYSGSVETLRKVFHPKALMAGYLQGQLVIGTPEPFFADIEKHPSMAENGAPYKAEIKSVDVVGQIASVILVETGFFDVMSFTDYFHLLKEHGEWKIISKTFTSE
jgi:4-oxalocrotonate tautomerase